jgi:nucleotide-binding universal stress UspA family protein
LVDIQRILCPIDFSEESRHALEHAVAFAKWYRAPITVLHVLSTPPPLVPPTGVSAGAPFPLAEPVEQIAEELRRFCQPLMPSGQQLEVVVQEGGAAREIVAHAESITADLVIMGTHGRGGFERLVLGSVTEKVLRLARCPVLTVPPRAPHAGVAPAAYGTILCPLDFSDTSARALEYALSLAQETDARLILAHVVEGVIEPARFGEVAHFSVPEYHRFLEQEAIMRLKAAVPDEARTWCKPEERVVSGNAAREIVRMAEDTGAQLIIMGVHGRGAVNRLLFGSTTHHIIREVSCPVLTLRA